MVCISEHFSDKALYKFICLLAAAAGSLVMTGSNTVMLSFMN